MDKSDKPSTFNNTVAFVKSFIKDKNVASVTPTAANVVRQICDRMDFSRDITVVEYGAGTGVFTFEILSRMTPGSRLLTFETNYDLAARLMKTSDSRLIVTEESAELVGKIMRENDLSEADYVLSGIPFSFLDPVLRVNLVKNTYQCLAVGGEFLAYQASWLMKDTIIEVFGNMKTDSYMMNLPPMFLMQAKKVG